MAIQGPRVQEHHSSEDTSSNTGSTPGAWDQGQVANYESVSGEEAAKMRAQAREDGAIHVPISPQGNGTAPDLDDMLAQMDENEVGTPWPMGADGMDLDASFLQLWNSDMGGFADGSLTGLNDWNAFNGDIANAPDMNTWQVSGGSYAVPDASP